VGPRSGVDDVEKRKFMTLPGLELRPLRHPARSQSLYRPSYRFEADDPIRDAGTPPPPPATMLAAPNVFRADNRVKEPPIFSDTLPAAAVRVAAYTSGHTDNMAMVLHPELPSGDTSCLSRCIYKCLRWCQSC
jgi:hypothetical protein